MNRIESRNNGIIKSVAALKDCSGRRAAGRFFFEGAQVEYVAGTIYWAGEFMYNIGLAEKGLG